MEDVVIIGFGGHAKSVVDSAIKLKKYKIIGYTDVVDRDCGLKYLGTDAVLKNINEAGIKKAVLGIGYMGNSFVRDSVVDQIKTLGFEFLTVVDPTATIAADAVIGEGVFIGKNVIVNADTRIGNYCIINTGSIIEHENVIGDYSHVAVGAVLCGDVKIGHHSVIGANTTIIQGKKIGCRCIIGANSTVLTDVKDDMKVYGLVKKLGGYDLTRHKHTEKSFYLTWDFEKKDWRCAV